MRLDCLFHTSPATLPAFLATGAAEFFCGDLYIEFARRPSLSFALNLETPPAFPGLAGILGGLSLADLSLKPEQLSAPFVPAPGTHVSASVLRSALAALRGLPGAPARITLLVPVDEAPELGAALHLADSHAIAWDAAAHPETDMVEFARWARAEALFTPATFRGLLPYTVQPLDAPAARHASRLARLFSETAPTATSTHPELILPGA